MKATTRLELCAACASMATLCAECLKCRDCCAHAYCPCCGLPASRFFASKTTGRVVVFRFACLCSERIICQRCKLCFEHCVRTDCLKKVMKKLPRKFDFDEEEHMKIKLTCCKDGCNNPRGSFTGSPAAITQAIELFRKSHMHGHDSADAQAVRFQSDTSIVHIHFTNEMCSLDRQREERTHERAHRANVSKAAKQVVKERGGA